MPIDFAIFNGELRELSYTTKTYPPFPVCRKSPDSTTNGQKIWILKDEHPLRDFQGTQLHDLLSGFTRTIHWVQKTLHIYIFPDSYQEQVSSMSKYSYKGFLRGVKHCAELLSAQKVHQYCQTYLMNKHNLKLPIPPLWRLSFLGCLAVVVLSRCLCFTLITTLQYQVSATRTSNNIA